MFAIAYKTHRGGSWRMEDRVYEDRERAQAIVDNAAKYTERFKQVIIPLTGLED